jgi:hypothetical protein
MSRPAAQAEAAPLSRESIEDIRREQRIRDTQVARGYVVADVVYDPPRQYRIDRVGTPDGSIIEVRVDLPYSTEEDAAEAAHAAEVYDALCRTYGEVNIMPAVPHSALAAEYGRDYKPGVMAFLVPGN